MGIIEELLDKNIHLQSVELRFTEKSIRVLALVIVSEELLCEVIVTRANFTSVNRVKLP